MIANIDFPRKIYEGDSDVITVNVDENLAGYKCRCEIYDDEENSVKFATIGAGGSDDEILITPGASSDITINISKDSTDGFKNKCYIEIEVEDSDGKVTTLFKKKFKLYLTNLDWTSK